MKRWLLLPIFLSLGCATPRPHHVATAQKIDIHAIESLAIGETSKNVMAALGQPTEKRVSSWRGKNVDFWIYDDTRSNQLASLLFDQVDGKLLNKLYIPQENTPERHLQSFIQTKGLQEPFETIKPPPCGRDYFSQESLLYYPNLGIIVSFESKSKIVESISWAEIGRTKEMIQEIKACRVQK